ncbi:MAG TPA: sugar phosphate isomerase/epimerase family protein [Candidatus Sulfotelmatobacter sp.]|nr:sugar phosphate isomerase/epimerase family protein [Candidatus Sulfotelmatobacter sp.]
MKIGLYSVTYRGVWYRGEAIRVFDLVRLAKQQGWEGVELDTERPHAAPMDLSSDDRKRLRDLAGELGIELCAVSPNCDLSSPVPGQREAMICYVRECIKLARDLGSPICKIFAAWRGITLHNGLGTYAETYGYNQYGFWKGDRRGFVVDCMRELCKVAEDHGIVLAMQNHGPDVVNRYQDVLELIEEVGSPAFKACMDINIEPEADSAGHARQMADASGKLQVHSHMNGEFRRRADGTVELVAGGYFDKNFWGRKVAYPAYVEALVAAGYKGYMNWEFCHPALENGEPVGIDYVHRQTEMAREYLAGLRTAAEQKLQLTSVG